VCSLRNAMSFRFDYFEDVDASSQSTGSTDDHNHSPFDPSPSHGDGGGGDGSDYGGSQILPLPASKIEDYSYPQTTEMDQDLLESLIPPSVPARSQSEFVSEDSSVPIRNRFCSTSRFLALICSLFLLLTILWPRAPHVTYKNTKVTIVLDDYNTTAGIELVQTFQFQNRNLYSVEWSDLAVKIYLCKITSSLPELDPGSNLSNSIDKTTDLKCDTNPVGTASLFSKIDHLNTKPWERAETHVHFKMSPSFEQIEHIVNMCSKYDVIRFYSVGSIEVKASQLYNWDFGSVNISYLELVDCPF